MAINFTRELGDLIAASPGEMSYNTPQTGTVSNGLCWLAKAGSLTYRQNVARLLPKHLSDDNIAVKPIAKELRVTSVKNSLSGA